MAEMLAPIMSKTVTMVSTVQEVGVLLEMVEQMEPEVQEVVELVELVGAVMVPLALSVEVPDKGSVLEDSVV
jgi:hypothetical protein